MKNKSNNKRQTTTAKVYIITIGITMILLLIGLIIFISIFLKENNLINENSKMPANVFMPEGKLNENNEFYPKITANDKIKTYLLG